MTAIERTRMVTSRATEVVGPIERSLLLYGHSGLTVATWAGLRLCGLEDLGVARVSAASVAHWQASTTVAVLLESRRGSGTVGGVREIRAAERATGRPVATCEVGVSAHLPDLVVWGPGGAGQEGGLAVEVELTAKAPRRLEQIVRGWRRAVSQGVVRRVLYVCSPQALRAVERAIASTDAHQQVRTAAMPAADVLSHVGRQPATA